MNQKPYTVPPLLYQFTQASPCLLPYSLSWMSTFSHPDTTIQKSLTQFHSSSKGFIGHIYIYCKQ